MSETDYNEQIDELLARADALPHGMAQYAFCDEAVSLADAHNDIDAGYKARQRYVEATTFSGQPEKALVAFTWCLAQYDGAPDRFRAHTLLWQYKWVANALPRFPQVSREQFAATIDDLERRFLAYGSTAQPICRVRHTAALKMGDLDAARDAFARLAKLKRGTLSDCEACEMDSRVWHHVCLGDDAAAVAAAGVILDGHYSCSSVPHETLAQVLLPLLRLGRGPEAMAHHRRGYLMISKNPLHFISEIGAHIKFLALTGNHTRGLRLIENYLHLALETRCPAWAFDFFLAVKVLLESRREVRSGPVRIRLPESFPERSGSGKYDLDRLHAWFAGRAAEIAAEFDARNGNDWYSGDLDQYQRMKPFAVDLPFTVRREE
jgi:hypothetical protein